MRRYAVRVASEIEQALFTALFDGVGETPLWSTFLTRLRGVTGAEYATLIFNPPERHVAEGLHLLSPAERPNPISAGSSIRAPIPRNGRRASAKGTPMHSTNCSDSIPRPRRPIIAERWNGPA